MSKAEKDNELVNFYLKDSFKSHVEDYYVYSDYEKLNEPRVLQMLYAVEWYNIPRDQYVDLIRWHPYLT